MKKNIAVIGCGHWGKNLVRNFAKLGSLFAISDPNLEIVKEFSTQYGVENLTFDDILKEPLIKGVVLAVPAPLHADMAIAAMESGKHVYVEKPLALSENEAKKMLKSSSANNVKIMVGHLLQYHPVFKAVRKIVNKGKLGKLSYIYSNRLSFGKVRSEENVIWSFAPHDISMILSLINKEPTKVRTESSCIIQPNISDIATIHMEFKSGLKAHISVSWLHPYKEQKLVVIGDSGMIVFDDTKEWDKKLALYRHTVEVSEGLPDIKKSEVEYLEVTQSEPLNDECKHFMDVVNNNFDPITDGEEGLKVLKVLEQTSSFSHKI